MKHIRNFIVVIICLLLVFYDGADLTKNEIKDLGVGASIYHNLHSNRKFAILHPPLSGIISFMSVKHFLNFNISSLATEPSGNYDDLVTYMYALKTPFILGEGILKNLQLQYSTYHIAMIMRIKNFCLVFLILLYLAYKNIPFTIAVAIVLLPLRIADSTSEIMSAFLIVCTLILMNSILYYRSRAKFVLLGIVLGLSISNYGFKGLILCGASICSSIISYDLQNKIKSRGFNLIWFLDVFFCIIVALTVTWILYGMDLVCICQLESLLELQSAFYKSIMNWKIVPFFDTFKQSMFEVIFRDNEDQQSFFQNIFTFFTLQNIILTLFAIESTIKQRNSYSILCCFLILSGIVLNTYGVILFRTISIAMIILCCMIFMHMLENKALRNI